MPAFDLSLVPPEPDLSFEQALWGAGLTVVAGIDEAGRGALAGPVSAAAVILPPDMAMASCLKGVRDSKQLTPVAEGDCAGKNSTLRRGLGGRFRNE